MILSFLVTYLVAVSANQKTAGELCTPRLFGSQCMFGLGCMKVGFQQSKCVRYRSLPENMQCSSGAFGGFCGLDMMCCSGQCLDKFACLVSGPDASKRVEITSEAIVDFARDPAISSNLDDILGTIRELKEDWRERIAPAEDAPVAPPSDSVMLEESRENTASNFFGCGHKVPGDTCDTQWFGSECQCGSMCMDLGSSKFCTHLNSLPKGHQCANTGNAVETFCGSGMTCCNGVCDDLGACLAGHAQTAASIAGTAATIAAAAAALG